MLCGLFVQRTMLASKRTRTTVGANAELVYVGEGLVPKNLPYRIKLNISGNTIGRGMQFRKGYNCASRLGAELTTPVCIQETAIFISTAKSSPVW